MTTKTTLTEIASAVLLDKWIKIPGARKRKWGRIIAISVDYDYDGYERLELTLKDIRNPITVSLDCDMELSDTEPND